LRSGRHPTARTLPALDAGSIAPDGNPEVRYFEEKIHNNLSEMTAKMYGPSEYNKMGFWGARTVTDARIGNPANPQWMITAPWEHDFLIWSLHHLAELGYADAAKPRDFELRWRVGVFSHRLMLGSETPIPAL